MSSTDMNATANTKAKPRKVGECMILRLSRGRSLKIMFRPRIRVAKLLVKLLAVATGLFTSVIGSNAFAAPPLNALPSGGQVVHGSSTIQQVGNALNINQASQKTIINWQSFDIGAQASVNFYQPNASAVALNRVLGDNASQIFGKLNANGQVFLLNPHGTLFAPGSQVNVGGLLNSTMHMTDENFINGSYTLTNPGNGILDNQGTINANSVVFAGNDITNSGNMIATTVSLVAGNTVAVDLSGDGLIRGRVVNPAMHASISNSGAIEATQQVNMSAGQVKDTINSLVNNTGIIRATGLVNEGGVITLQAGKALNSGSLEVSSTTGVGGTVAMLGEHVGITGAGSVDASGKTGGGTILVGGDFQGKNAEVQNASRTFFGKDASLSADATETGNGGKIIVWADEVTRGYGNISARGGDVSGNGGFVEVSGKRSLDYQASTDTRAPNGNIGTLLLDPDFITISSISVNAGLVDVDQFADPTVNAIIAPSTINSALSNVILQANEDISFDEAVSIVAAGVGITAQAGGFVFVQAPITTNGGVVSLTAGDPGSLNSPNEGALVINANIDTTRGGVAPNGANVLLESNLSDVGGNSIQLSANVNAGSLGDIIITDNGGDTNQFSGILTGNKLQVLATHNVTLTNANQLNSVEIETTNSLPTSISNIVFNNTRSLTIDGLTVSAGGGDGGSITVTNSNNILQSGDISTHNGNINLSTTTANRTYTLDNGVSIFTGIPGNPISVSATGDILANDNTHAIFSSAGDADISLTSTNNIGSLAQSIRINPGTGDVSLISGGNIYTHQIGGILETSRYTVTASLNNAQVQLLSANNVNINTSLISSSQFTTQDDNLVFTSTGGNVNISDNITIESNSVNFISTTGNINVGSGTGTLTLIANNPTGVIFDAGNAVSFNNGVLHDTSIGGDVIEVIAGAGGVNGAGVITVDNLSISSVGTVNLTGNHNVGTLAATVTQIGNGFTFNNGQNLTIGSVGAINGITTNDGVAIITTNNAGLFINESIDLGNVDLTLNATGLTQAFINSNSSGSMVAHNTTLNAGSDISLFALIDASGHVTIDSTLGNVTIGDGSGSTLIQSAGNIGITAGNDIVINGSIEHTASTVHALTLSADANIIVAPESEITSPNAALNITFTSDADNTGPLGGRIRLLNDTSAGGVTIESNGGDITFTGGSGFSNTSFLDGIGLTEATLDARAGSGVGGNITLNGRSSDTDAPTSGVSIVDSHIKTAGSGEVNIDGRRATANIGSRGVVISNSEITAHDGGITINGNANVLNSGGANSDGVLINAGSLIIAEDSGSINITGVSAIGGTSQSGIAIADSPTEIDTHGTGNITLNGTSNGSGANSFGIVMFSNALVETEGTGNIAIGGIANNIDAPGVAIGSGSAIKSLQGGDILINAGNQNSTNVGGDHISFVGGAIQGTSGTIMSLIPVNNGTGIAVGGDGSTVGNFNVSDADLAAITGIQSFQIGDFSHTGTYNVQSLSTFSATNEQINLVSNTPTIEFLAPTTLNSSLLVNANNGAVEFNMIGALNSTSKVNVIAQNDIVAITDSSILAGPQGAEFKSTTGDIILSSVNTAGDIKAVANGDITINGGAVLTGNNILLAAQTGNFINNAGATALVAGPGKWVVASQTPSADTLGGLVYNYKQYNTTYDPVNNVFSQTLLGTGNGAGNGFVYSVAPTLTPSLVGNSNDISRVYNATNNIDGLDLLDFTPANFTATGTINGDMVSGYNFTNAIYIDKNVGVGKTVTVSGLNLNVTDANGVQVFGYGGQTGIASLSGNIGEITPASLTVTGQTANNKVYDGGFSTSLSGGTLNGVFGGDVVSLNNGIGLFATKTVGTGKAVSVSGTSLGGTDAGNYLVANPTGLTANITPLALTVSGQTANNKIYDATNTASISGGSLVGAIVDDFVFLSNGTGTFADKNVGTGKSVTVNGTGLTGTDAINYTITDPTGITANIIPAEITSVSGLAVSNKVYDATNNASVVGGGETLTGKFAGDTVFVDSAMGIFADPNAGSAKVVNITGITLSGTDAGNYMLVDNTSTSLADISQAALALNAVSDSRTYNALTSSTGTVALVGLQGSDTVTALTQSFDSKNAGARTLIVDSGYVVNDGNGGLNYAVTTNTAAGSITPASISSVAGITANSKTYDGTTVATLNTGSASFSGKFTGDSLTVASATGEFAGGALTGKNAGLEKLVNVTGITLGGADAGNYTLANNTATALGDITPRDLTVSAQGINKVFDGTTAAQVTLTDNRIAGDNLTITNSSASFADANVGVNKQIDVLGIVIDSGTDAANYNLLNTDAIAFADIFKEDGTKEANLTETNVIDSTQNLTLALTPIQVKIVNPDGSESVINVDVPKGKVLSCK